MHRSSEEQNFVLRTELLGMRQFWLGIERDLSHMGIERLTDLQGRTSEQLCTLYATLMRRSADEVLLDVFTALIAFAETGEPQPWWLFARRRAAARYRSLELGRDTRHRE